MPSLSRLLRAGLALTFLLSTVHCTVEGFDAGGKECTPALACPEPYVCEEVGAERRQLCVRQLGFQAGLEPSVDYSGAAETYLSELTPTISFGGRELVRADGDEANDLTNKKDIVLLRWTLDDPALPDLQTLHAVALDLRILDPTIAAFDIFPLLRPWNEATATWVLANEGQPWGGPGATGADDRGPTKMGAVEARANGPYRTWLNADGVVTVRGWLDEPSANHGVLLVGDTYDAVIFASREDKTRNAPARLVLYFH